MTRKVAKKALFCDSCNTSNDKIVDKIFDDFEEREKFLVTKDIVCDDCIYYLSDNGKFTIDPCMECSRFYSDMFERKA